MKSICTVLALLLFVSCTAQKKARQVSTGAAYTPGNVRVTDGQKMMEMKSSSPFGSIPFRCIGPTVMSGRVVDVDVDPSDPTHFYVAYASGGLWVTHNNGASFEPLFQDQAVMTIGDICVDWKHDETIWLGSGENNSSRSSYSGTGVFKSYDKGKSWQYLGLPESHHIGRILLHPDDPNIAWVAVIGHLYTHNPERGIFKTVDGGTTWKQVFSAGDDAGVIDMVIDPLQPNEMYASTWQRSRRAWNFTEAGKKSDVIFSRDGGNTWSSMAFPTPGIRASDLSEGLGRIGLALHHSSKGKFLYAILDNQNHREKKEEKDEEKDLLKKNDFKEMSRDTFLVLDNKKLEKFLRDNNFPKENTAESVKKSVEINALQVSALYEYLFDSNEDLFSTPVIGAEVYSYDFATGQWNRTHEDYLDDIVYTYGYYFGLIRVDGNDPQKIYIAGVPLLKSKDGGKHFEGIKAGNVHGDHHALWIDPQRPGHLINGSDGGVQVSYDDGETFVNCNSPSVGQFYSIAVDNDTPYNVYGGLQDNGVWVGRSTNEPSDEWHQSGKYPFDFLMGGDGMQVQVDTRDNSTVYTGYQFGWYSRLDREQDRVKSVRPQHKLGEKPLRWNWQSPILLSKWNQDIFYIGSNKIHRSFNKGESFETLSPDLTHGGKPGDVPYGTLTCIAESPVVFGILATGSDDGMVYLSTDAGQNWRDVSPGLPSGYWVSRVVLSGFKKERMYVSMNGYRDDDMQPMIFVSENSGKNWTSIASNLPLGPVNVIREDPTNENLLFVGTDHGVFVSLDRGNKWEAMSTHLPNVPVHDIAVQAREKDIVLGTHGRSLWIGGIGELEQLAASPGADVVLFDLNQLNWSSRWGKSWSQWDESKLPEYNFPVYLRTPALKAELTIALDSLELVRLSPVNLPYGINYLPYDLTIPESLVQPLEMALNKKLVDEEDKIAIKKSDNDKYYLPPATYSVTLQVGDSRQTKKWNISR